MFTCASCLVIFFFFSSRRRHTRFKCDWSSDVCSSDLESQDMQIGLNLHILRLDDCFRTPLGFRSEFTATQHRLSLFEIGVAARELCRQALVVGHRGFHLLLRRRMSLIQALLALALGVGPNQVRTYCFPTSFSRRDLRLCLIDTGERFGYTRVLQLALATLVFDCGTCPPNSCPRLAHFCPGILVP